MENLRVKHDGVTQSSYHINVNRGKRSSGVDIKHPGRFEIILELIKKCDINIRKLAPGVMERLKLDYDSVKKIKTGHHFIVHSCFGHWGRSATSRVTDVIAQAASGWTGGSNPPSWAGLHRRHNSSPCMPARHAPALHHKVVTARRSEY